MRPFVLSAVLAALLAPRGASALSWPDVEETVERALADPDPGARTVAVSRLERVGPARGVPLVRMALGDQSVDVRLAAADVAVHIHATGATALVLPWLRDADPRLRAAACTVARALPDPTSVAPLERTLSDVDGTVRALAVQALAEQGVADAVPALLGKMDDASPAVRVELARALARLRDARAVVPLMGKVEDSSADVRQAVAHALGDLGDPRGAAAVLLQLRDSSTEVRIAALDALSRLPGENAVDAVASLLSDRASEVRSAALSTLGAWAEAGSKGALRVLLGHAGTDEDATLDVAATPTREALRRAGAVAVPALRAKLRGGASPAAVRTAAWVLGELRTRDAAPDVVAALRQGALPPAAALHALGKLGSPDDLLVVLEYVSDESSAVRRSAFAATRALLDPSHPDGRAVDPLLSVLHRPSLSRAEERAVIDLLGRARTRRAVDVLRDLAHRKDAATRVAALDALESIGPAGADDVLLELTTDDVPEVRLHAALALASAGGERARDALLLQLRDGAQIDRVGALTALAGVLTRAPCDAAWSQLLRALPLAAGGERDAILHVLGRAAPVDATLSTLLRDADVDDRRTLAASLAGRPEALGWLKTMAGDASPSVRSDAAWSLGSVAGGDAAAYLQTLAATAPDGDLDVAVNATAALGRIAARAGDPTALEALCALARDVRPLVRANAVAGVALARRRCGDGSSERALLGDPSERVRAAAARALSRAPRAEDGDLLGRCAAEERSGLVASTCRGTPEALVGPPRPTVAYVQPAVLSPPRPHTAYLVELADGMLRAGTTDRRGAFVDPVAPDGLLRLYPAEELYGGGAR